MGAPAAEVRPVEEKGQPRKRNSQRRVCPKCANESVSRSRRRTVSDYLLALVGLRPYRCRECDYRYHARSRDRGRPRERRSRWAQWPRCRSTDVDRIARRPKD